MSSTDPLLHRPRRGAPRWTAVLLAAVLCAACAPLQPPPPPPPPPAPPPAPPAPKVIYVPMLEPEDLATRQLLAYQAALSKMPPAEWPKEGARLGEGGSLEDTMKLALVLGHTHGSGELARAQGLLDKVLANPSIEAQAWHGLARLLAGLFNEQRRNEEQIERLNQQMRDTQRDNQRKLDQLNEKLEALKSIERSLNNRIPGTPMLPSAVPPAAPASTVKPAPRS